MSCSVRVERIEKLPAYDHAFDYLTRFYRRKAGGKKGISRLKLGHKASEEIDLTNESDEDMGDGLKSGVVETNGHHEVKGADEGGADSIGLAAGLPGTAPLVLLTALICL